MSWPLQTTVLAANGSTPHPCERSNPAIVRRPAPGNRGIVGEERADRLMPLRRAHAHYTRRLLGRGSSAAPRRDPYLFALANKATKLLGSGAPPISTLTSASCCHGNDQREIAANLKQFAVFRSSVQYRVCCVRNCRLCGAPSRLRCGGRCIASHGVPGL